MAYAPPPVATREYHDWAIENREEWRYLGTLPDEAGPVVYDPAGYVYRATPDPESERLVPEEEPAWELDAEETVAGFLERIGETTGWDSLSEWANEHLDSGEDDDG